MSGYSDSQSIHAKLLWEVKQGVYRYSERLPRESILAERLNISRTQLRDGLSQLEREGFISRRQGVGTIINRHVLEVKVRTDLEVEFIDMVEQSGHHAGVSFVHVQKTVAGADTAKRLRIHEGSDILSVSRLITADGKETIYCEDYVPCIIIKDSSYSEEDFQAPIFQFLKRFCEVEPYLDLTEIRPVSADARLSELFKIEKGTPLLYMDEVDYDIDGMPILYSVQYYTDGTIRHFLMRRKF
ncbi:MAG: putative HTH-type transcriptional regulator YidP [Firmicutes bacterium ADurb.Bin182]|nr:MAG: putative HTH-type transcriptional regulator YidP [Firmicutes bacterium ADurb.Bin182]